MELGYERAFRRWVEERDGRWERTRYPREGSDTLAYRIALRQEPRAVVTVLHGAGNDALFGFVGTFKRLLEEGFEVFTFDLDGHGRSSETRFSAAQARTALPAALDRSGAAERGLPAHALGVSLGGVVLLASLPACQGRLRSAALICAPLSIELSRRAIVRELHPRIAATLWRERKHAGLTGLIPSFGPFRRSTFPLRLAEAPGPGSFGYVQTLNRVLDDLELEKAAAATELPVLLVYGEADRIVPVVQGERLARALPGARLLRLPRETHLSVPLAAAALEALLTWLNQHTPDA